MVNLLVVDPPAAPAQSCPGCGHRCASTPRLPRTGPWEQAGGERGQGRVPLSTPGYSAGRGQWAHRYCKRAAQSNAGCSRHSKQGWGIAGAAGRGRVLLGCILQQLAGVLLRGGKGQRASGLRRTVRRGGLGSVATNAAPTLHALAGAHSEAGRRVGRQAGQPATLLEPNSGAPRQIKKEDAAQRTRARYRMSLCRSQRTGAPAARRARLI